MPKLPSPHNVTLVIEVRDVLAHDVAEAIDKAIARLAPANLNHPTIRVTAPGVTSVRDKKAS